MSALSSSLFSALGLFHLLIHGFGTCGDTRLSRALAMLFMSYLFTEIVVS